MALFVFSMFFIHFGLVKNGLIEQFSAAYFVALVPLVFLQYKTVTTLFRVNARVLEKPRLQTATTAA